MYIPNLIHAQQTLSGDISFQIICICKCYIKIYSFIFFIGANFLTYTMQGVIILIKITFVYRSTDNR